LRREAEATALITFARRTKNWPLLKEAVEENIADQQGFVAAWEEAVGINHGGDRSGQVCRTAYLKLEAAERLTGIMQPTVAKWKHRLCDLPAYRLRLYGPSYRAAMGTMSNVGGDGAFAGQSFSSEHYTPAIYIEAAREVLGRIDLDPASNARAQKTVKAGAYFTEKDDGLQQEWRGNVWLNPPYGDLVGEFIAKLSAELAAGASWRPGRKRSSQRAISQIMPYGII
jgi:DNA N-6-adenine-methyltransferase (Dam)